MRRSYIYILAAGILVLILGILIVVVYRGRGKDLADKETLVTVEQRYVAEKEKVISKARDWEDFRSGAGRTPDTGARSKMAFLTRLKHRIIDITREFFSGDVPSENIKEE
ncbi:MAG: hypothetical protein PHH49_04790 [Candidatus Omnitrophica bacterium]|nr:hypothetical protein [Candidatus Omnitrophota bacterium]